MSSIPNGLRDVLAKLEYLSMIEDNKKPCMNNYTFVDADSWVGASQRFLGGESQQVMLVHINSIIDHGIQALREYPDFTDLIIDNLRKAVAGIQRLVRTYARKPGTVSQLSVCIKNIQLQIDNYYDNYNDQDDKKIVDKHHNDSHHNDDINHNNNNNNNNNNVKKNRRNQSQAINIPPNNS